MDSPRRTPVPPSVPVGHVGGHGKCTLPELGTQRLQTVVTTGQEDNTIPGGRQRPSPRLADARGRSSDDGNTSGSGISTHGCEDSFAHRDSPRILPGEATVAITLWPWHVKPEARDLRPALRDMAIGAGHTLRSAEPTPQWVSELTR
jgi:hypothetical protein